MLDLRADRVEGRVEGLLGDGEVGDAHGDDALLAPDEERQRRLQRQDLEHARAASASFAWSASARGWTRLSSAASCGWMPSATVSGLLAGSSSRSVASISASSLIVSIRRALEPERLRAIAALAAARLHLQRARQRVRVVLEGDHAQDPRGLRVDLDDAALEKPWRERCHAASVERPRHARVTRASPSQGECTSAASSTPRRFDRVALDGDQRAPPWRTHLRTRRLGLTREQVRWRWVTNRSRGRVRPGDYVHESDDVALALASVSTGCLRSSAPADARPSR